MTQTQMLKPCEVAAVLGCSTAKVLTLIRGNKLPAKDINQGGRKSRWLIRQIDLDRFLTPDNAPMARTPRLRRLDADV